MPRRPSPYGRAYQRERAALLAAGPPCTLRLVCGGVRADSADHDPPLAAHDHVNGSGCCTLRPACLACQKVQGGLIHAGKAGVRRPVPVPSRAW